MPALKPKPFGSEEVSDLLCCHLFGAEFAELLSVSLILPGTQLAFVWCDAFPSFLKDRCFRLKDFMWLGRVPDFCSLTYGVCVLVLVFCLRTPLPHSAAVLSPRLCCCSHFTVALCEAAGPEVWLMHCTPREKLTLLISAGQRKRRLIRSIRRTRRGFAFLMVQPAVACAAGSAQAGSCACFDLSITCSVIAGHGASPLSAIWRQYDPAAPQRVSEVSHVPCSL